MGISREPLNGGVPVGREVVPRRFNRQIANGGAATRQAGGNVGAKVPSGKFTTSRYRRCVFGTAVLRKLGQGFGAVDDPISRMHCATLVGSHSSHPPTSKSLHNQATGKMLDVVCIIKADALAFAYEFMSGDAAPERARKS